MSLSRGSIGYGPIRWPSVAIIRSVAAGVAADFRQGADLARASIDSGKAAEKAVRLAEFTAAIV